ncbi:sugar phosphate isomerase/epimerase family protein [Fusobacterium sp. PH5-44]|uniref:sugar phosphate isomerase/epimerase family protein n=1 Tax=unclassified Fusobacterium TaxID=2648384 RepID=UPI003D239AF9
MKLGFLTGIMGDIPIEEKIEWAHMIGFETLEVSCWPRDNSRDYAGSDIDVNNFTQNKADKLNKILKDKNMTIATLAYYDNNLDHDFAKRSAYNNHLIKVIDAAALLGIKNVGTFIGRDMALTIEDNFDEMEKVFRPILEYAQGKNVRIIIENCSMPGWHPSGWAGTISYSPELWDEMFKRLPYDNFGLNYDPSHLLWLGIDYIKGLHDYKDRIFQVHAKDTEMFYDKLNYYGILGKQLGRQDNWDLGFWRHRMPGKGNVDWKKFVETLKEIGYNDELVIEHEDLEYEGTIEKVKEGLELGYIYLKGLLGNK